MHEAGREHPITISATYLGAHSVPKGKTPSEATDDIVNYQLPTLKRMTDEGQISPENIDVFFEKGVFERDDTRRILEVSLILYKEMFIVLPV